MTASLRRSCLCIVLALFGCAAPDQPKQASRPIGQGKPIYLFDAGAAIQDAWLHMPFREATDYHLAVFDGSVAIRARGRRSASALVRPLDLDPRLCPEIEWAWAVTQGQRTANLHEKSGEDVAASLMLLFGDPGFLSSPNKVPTLRYVWTTDHVERDTVIDSPYLSGIVRSIVVETRAAPVAAWVTVQRNVLKDFERAFGQAPRENIRAIALFTDNDQTEEPVEAYYGWARARCAADAMLGAQGLWKELPGEP